MEKVRVYYDREGNTLSVWFDDPKKERFCEESDDDLVLVKDRRGRVIGFERLNFLTAKQRADGGGIPLEIVKRLGAVKGFLVLPKRWIVERTYGWLGRCRRLAKDYENLTRSHLGFVTLAMIRLMLRRIVRLTTSK